MNIPHGLMPAKCVFPSGSYALAEKLEDGAVELVKDFLFSAYDKETPEST